MPGRSLLTRALRAGPARVGVRARVRDLVRTAALAAALAVVPAAGSATAAGAAGPAPGDAASVEAAGPGRAVTVAEPDERRVVVVGVTGLRWDDVGALTTPALWGLAQDGTVGTVAARSIRSSACPADGWLALSAGARSADLPGEAPGECRRLRLPPVGEPVPGWADYLQSADEEDFDARPGVLGQAVRDAGVTATGFGGGAAIALAGPDGLPVGDLAPLPGAGTLGDRVGEALTTSELVVLDAGAVRDPGHALVDRAASGIDEDGDGLPDPDAEPVPEPPAGEEADLTAPDAVTEPSRLDQVRAVDAHLGAVLAAVAAADHDTTVVVASLADSGPSPHLQLAAALGPGATQDAAPFAGGLLSSRSTRQPGFVMTTDLAPTVLTALGARDRAPEGALVGSPVSLVPGPATADGRVAAMVDEDRHAWAVRPLVGPFFGVLILANLVLYALVTLGLNGAVLESLGSGLNRVLPGRPGRGVAGALRSRPGPMLSGLRVAGVAVASVPVSTFLANLVPWWRAQPPSTVLAALVVAWVAAVTGLALLPRWKRWLLGPLGVVAAVTAVVVAADVVTGGRLQISSLMGVQPLVGARFYGFNNQAFALFAATTVLLAAALANPLVQRGRRRQAAALVAVVGVVATVLDGMPGLGSDFGGPPALVPGFAVLALLAAGVRIGWAKALAVLVAGAVVVTGFAVVDWTRPPDSRTHLGRFVQTVLDGGLWPVLTRKAAQNLEILFGNGLTLLAIAGIALVVLVLGRPLRTAASAPDGGPFGWLSAGAPLTRLGTDAPMLRPGLIALAVTLGIGFALNDSGVVIPAVGISVAVPLLAAACAGWMLSVRPDPARTPAPVTPERSPAPPAR
ncbi:hypothetical protein [Cellulomonas aerilata]|uniref:Alkaline phosphatase family protein n=1 Tax=Cellulomonas aerilata TaxID=515326 RepID=A0A512D793_9CELL|nr:hypothetical protein [Cellulomonas aerilata]GEO32352.1 hypothetical protein CAE01nite_00770 [Cellulomonas aerilata]